MQKVLSDKRQHNGGAVNFKKSQPKCSEAKRGLTGLDFGAERTSEARKRSIKVKILKLILIRR